MHFKLLHEVDQRGGIKSLGVGLEIKIGDLEVALPITPMFERYEDFEREVERAAQGLKDLISKAERLVKGGDEEEGITEEMDAPKIWEILNRIEDDEEFCRRFNSMGEEQRREVAEYVLTQCNIFSGKASVFSARYNSKSLLLE